jgi:hypothetical protein
VCVGENPIIAGRSGISGLISVPLNGHPELGMYDFLPPKGNVSNSNLSKQIIDLTRGRDFAWVHQKFTAGLTSYLNRRAPNQLSSAILNEMHIFFTQYINYPDPEERELASTLALVFAGLVFAAQMNVAPPWTRDKIGHDLAKIYRLVQVEYGQALAEPELLLEEDIDRFRAFLLGMIQAGKVLTLQFHANKPAWTSEEAQNADAFWWDEPAPGACSVREEILSRWSSSAEKKRLLVRFLNEKEFLLLDKNRTDVSTRQHEIKSIPGRPRYYDIAASFIYPAGPGTVKHVPITSLKGLELGRAGLEKITLNENKNEVYPELSLGTGLIKSPGNVDSNLT